MNTTSITEVFFAEEKETKFYNSINDAHRAIHEYRLANELEVMYAPCITNKETFATYMIATGDENKARYFMQYIEDLK